MINFIQKNVVCCDRKRTQSLDSKQSYLLCRNLRPALERRPGAAVGYFTPFNRHGLSSLLIQKRVDIRHNEKVQKMFKLVPSKQNRAISEAFTFRVYCMQFVRPPGAITN